MKWIYRKLKTIITTATFSESVPLRAFILVSNLFFFIERKGVRFSKTYIKDKGEFFFIAQESKLGLKKYFAFRKQGFIVFNKGIRERGNSLAKEYLIDDLEFKKGDIIIDVGANTGDLKIFFENKRILTKYHAIEPGVREFWCLSSNLSTEDKTYNLALGDSDGLKEFYYSPEFGDSSIVKMQNYKYSYNVDVLKLSTFFEMNKDLKSGRIKLLKLEAEGFEPEIIMNAGPFISKVDYIAADLGFERGINQETTAPEVINFLLRNDFVLEKVNGERFTFLFKNIQKS